MFDGGMLPSIFKIDGWTREFNILNFKDTGDCWARFEIWQNFELKKKRKDKMWGYFTKLGALLAIFLTILRLLDFLKSENFM